MLKNLILGTLENKEMLGISLQGVHNRPALGLLFTIRNVVIEQEN